MMCDMHCDPESEFAVLCSGYNCDGRTSTNALLASTLCSSRSRDGQPAKQFCPHIGCFHLDIIFVLQREIFVMNLVIILCNSYMDILVYTGNQNLIRCKS